MRPPGALRDHVNTQRGAALVITLIVLALLAAGAFSLVVLTATEVRVSGHYAGAREALYAAEGALEIAAYELLLVADWNAVLGGSVRSRFTDGLPAGTRQLSDGSFVNLADATRAANSETRPWGSNNPRWQLFAFGRLGSGPYVMAWAADDPAETDDDPLQDGADSLNPGAGVMMIRAEAFGPQGAHKTLEAIVRRATGSGGESLLQMLSWSEVR